MVLLKFPPPEREPGPLFYELPIGSVLYRLFRPEPHGTGALTFRGYGPLGRFDHHQGQGEGRRPHREPAGRRAIYYAAFSLSGCLVEIFGDTGVVEVEDYLLALVGTARELRLLDLRGGGAMRAGTNAALAKTESRTLTQAWSRYFYETRSLYGSIDGLLYYNAHNDEEALALYERCDNALSCPGERVVALSEPALRPRLLEAVRDNNLHLPDFPWRL